MLSFKRIAGSSSSQAPFSVSAETIANNEDLLTELLLRLPIKSLLKFKCVSKHWLSLISNPRFSRRRISCDTPPCGLFLIERGSPYAGYQFVALDSNHSKAPFKNLTFVNDPSEIKFIQSCNGLLLFRSLRPGRSGRIYYVYNPTTKQHTTIPRPRRAVGAALAFDPSKSPHYKVICVRECQFWLQHQYEIQMYSSNSGPWRVSGDPFTTKGSDKQFNGGVFCNGVIYWLDVSGTGVSLCFDIDGEKLEQMPRRKEIIDRRQQIRRRKMRNELLVKWKGQPTEDAEWVEEDYVKKTRFSKGGIVVTVPALPWPSTSRLKKKGSLGALDAQIEGDEGRDILTEALTALDGRDEDEMKTDGKEASSARLFAGKRENVSVYGRDEKGKDLHGRLR